MDQPSLLFTVYCLNPAAPPALSGPQTTDGGGVRQGAGAPHPRTMSHSPGKGNILKSGVTKNRRIVIAARPELSRAYKSAARYFG
jgi:hypothetical protein